ncbi:MAG: universal stress protein [Allosphingosinicella sp.]|uniref:universal stress protein n=1 Tax=Allosphingosinicella sp. TaxID=2823234 RepID=UPI00395FB4E3
MTIETVFLHAASETLEPNRGAAAYALGLARSWQAHLKALVIELDMMPWSASGRSIAADGRGHGEQRDGGTGTVANALRAAAQAQGVEALVITDRSHIHSTPEIAADHARLADIVVAGVRDEGLLSERLVAESLVFQSGRPVIAVSHDHGGTCGAERILVAWDFSRVAARAVADALPFLRRASEVTLISFGDDKDFAASTDQDEVLAALRRRGVEARFQQTERRGQEIGEAIHAAVRETRADLLVMGGFGHSRFRDFVLGGATKSILAAPPVPTLFSH